MSETGHDISILNGLVSATLDSVKSYTEAAKESETGSHGAMFPLRASERHQASATGRDARRQPEDEGKIAGGVHCLFINLKAVMTHHDDKAIINEVEAGEDHIKAKFEDALEDRELSPAVRSLIETAYASVKEGHNEMRDLKHSLRD
ncbi:PA2169 family four-helix-bundle protein [Sphingobium sufflavum]|uniref:PA2169 family four-helix-bundle protein n=1 Tax=Sphingobium sufflavum TaxID=1129547 RepID=UPI001F4754D3|nr:PA2169 family four-helix-bundle protein [Sphingobium sufflavum]MCE7797264.1 PA2169 family four-helix-bundle protein [Sphingobium sufflavum]